MRGIRILRMMCLRNVGGLFNWKPMVYVVTRFRLNDLCVMDFSHQVGSFSRSSFSARVYKTMPFSA